MAELCDEKSLENVSFDVIYSRFSLHSIRRVEEDKVLDFVQSNLKGGGLFLVEARSTEDELCGEGTPVKGEKMAFMSDHFRRFIDIGEFVTRLQERGMEIVQQKKGRGMAVFGEEDPVVIRVVAKKKLQN